MKKKKEKRTKVKEYIDSPIFINLLAIFFTIQEEKKKWRVKVYPTRDFFPKEVVSSKFYVWSE